MTELRAEDDLDREPAPDRLCSEVYWILQFLSFVGFFIGYFWIASAFLSQHQGTDADHVSVDGGLAWDLGVVPVMIATGLTTVVLMLLAGKASGWLGVVGAFLLQGALALILTYVLIDSSGIGY
ncbi:hypothetical protein ACTXKH_18405 [Brachybacterium tyrofermentans]|uniref:hypothetical protein n=1 Tax=Brachybacterium tyrofermentans TaxID=47848 RepID=UPI0026D83791